MKKIIALVIIVCIAATLRLYDLGKVPSSPDWDEAAIGYNAFSILHTGRDEYGTFLPLTFRSFGDYKPPLYIYLTVPSVAVFGLNTFAVRLPSALFGILAVLGIYFLTQEVLLLGQDVDDINMNGPDNRPNEKNTRNRINIHTVPYLPLVAAAVLAISPWHLQFSRVGFETNISLTCIIWAVWAFLLSLRRNVFLPVSVILFVFSMYAYHTPRLFVPLLGIVFLILFRKVLFPGKNESQQTNVGVAKQWLIGSIILAIILLLPIVRMTLDTSALSRLSGTSLMGKQTEVLERSATYLKDDKASGNIIGQLVNNRRVVWLQAYLNGYLSHFSLRWLFVTGDYPRHHAPDMGLLYLIELPLLLLGLVQVYRINGKSKSVILWWLLLGPIAAALTFETPHAVRAYVMVPMYELIIALGLVWVIEYGRRSLIKGLCVGILILAAYGCNFAYYQTMYYVAMDREFASDWQYGYSQAIAIAQKYRSQGYTITMSEKLEQPYIFVLFYTAYDPVAYQRATGSLAKKIPGYEFVPTIDEHIRTGKQVYIGLPGELSEPHKEVVKDLAGNIRMVINE